MKDSHLRTPRTMDEGHWTPGYVIHEPKISKWERVADYVLAIVIGVCVAATLVTWWSA